MTTPAASRKPAYRTFVVERHVAAPRDAVWQALVDLLEASDIGPAAEGVGVERVLSLEPPWRRSARLEVEGAGLVEHTVAIRDDGQSCHLVWALVAEQPDGDDQRFDRLVTTLEAVLTASCERVARSVKSG